MSSPDEPIEIDLVMPFVVVASKGGPYDDDSYCAGYEMARLDAALEAGPRHHQVTIRTANATQADLIAMHHGYVCQFNPSPEFPDWTHATFTRQHEEHR